MRVELLIDKKLEQAFHVEITLQTFYMHMSDSCRTSSNQLYWNSVLQPKVGKIHFDCGQTCFEEEELNLRLKGGPVTVTVIVRERETEVDVTFHFVSFSVCTLVLNKRCQRQTGVFTMFHLVQSFVARCCKMWCAQRRTIWKVTDPITIVMAVRHFVSRSRLIAPKSLATV